SRQRRLTQFYCCAPPAMMRMARMTLRQLDFPEQNLHSEAFVPAIAPPIRRVNTERSHRIVATGQRERVEFQIFGDETILDGALRQGIALPYSCKSGVCLTCLARCVHGEVDMAFAQITQHGRPGDMVNTCIGYAATDMVEIAYD
ncbi:MAG: 2Fe-2S iron-sulfur cluster-binding protein, partial [Saprospiraceae bacterium]